MSRRTKLCITALFLVLLAIPVVYLVLTWSPAPPLQFRIVRDTGERYLAGHARHVRVYEVEVRNTALTAIHFTAGDLTWDDAALRRSLVRTSRLPYAGSAPSVYYTGHFDLGADQRPVEPLPLCGTIPALSTRLVRLMMVEDEAPQLAIRPHFLVYGWMSQTRRRILRLQHLLLPRLPQPSNTASAPPPWKKHSPASMPLRYPTPPTDPQPSPSATTIPH